MFSTQLFHKVSVGVALLFLLGVASANSAQSRDSLANVANNLSSNDISGLKHRGGMDRKLKKIPPFCTREYIPVLCGDDKDEFPNMCHAELAGFHKRECMTKEPEPFSPKQSDRMLRGNGKRNGGEPVICPYIYDPVLCGDDDEEFPSLCEAEAAGYHKRECTAKEPELVLLGGMDRGLRGSSTGGK